jgi:transposase
MWCLGKITAAFIACMELILRLYALPYDPQYPVICFDERPCQLLGSPNPESNMRPGRCARQDSEYIRKGTCCVLASIEPLTGKRLVHVKRRRRNREFTAFMIQLAKQYPDAKKIRVVLDNLSTHTYGAFYQNLSAEEAAQLAERIQFVYTPKKASWLNMIEIEFSALSRQCLNRRIGSLNEHVKEVFAFMKNRDEQGVKINWQFTIDKAREKLNSGYRRVNEENKKYL